MSKKAKLYLLILINLIAWGYVGCKVYSALQGDDDVALNYDKPIITNVAEVNETDAEILNLNYPDPFLKYGTFTSTKVHSSHQVNNNSTNTVKETQKAKTTQSLTTQPLDIKYLGLIKSSEKGKTTAMLVIDGKSYFVKQNDVVEGYVIKQIFDNSVVIVKGKGKITIQK